MMDPVIPRIRTVAPPVSTEIRTDGSHPGGGQIPGDPVEDPMVERVSVEQDDRRPIPVIRVKNRYPFVRSLWHVTTSSPVTIHSSAWLHAARLLWHAPPVRSFYRFTISNLFPKPGGIQNTTEGTGIHAPWATLNLAADVLKEASNARYRT
jgi:hypothetical protein